MTEQVDHPGHYNAGDIECIDAIEAALGREQFIGFLRGQVIKYQWRVGLKGPGDIDARKAQWYGDRLVGLLGESEGPPVPNHDWKVWTGGRDAPIPRQTLHMVRFRDGSIRSALDPIDWDWTHSNSNRDIIAYRILPS